MAGISAALPDPPTAAGPDPASLPLVHPTARVVDSHLGPWTEVGAGWSLLEAHLGDYSYAAGCDGVIHYTRVGKYCSLASHVVLNPGDHPMDWVTQHHLTYRRSRYGLGPDAAPVFARRRARGCTIGHDVWMGHGAMVMAGVSIGNGAVVAAGAVVTRDVDPYTIVAGVPARPLRRRFPAEVVERLQAIAWWDWAPELLRQRLEDFSDLEGFLERYGG